MYSKKILERFTNPSYAGGIRGGDGTGRAESGAEVIKIYIAVSPSGEIKSARFKAYGGVCTIVACDIACELIEDLSLDKALTITSNDIAQEIDLPQNKMDSAILAEEAIKNAVEDYYKKKEKELKKR